MLRPGSWTLGDKGTHYIKTIKNSSNHLATLINDILDAAAMAKGKLVIKQETVSPSYLFTNIVTTPPLASSGQWHQSVVSMKLCCAVLCCAVLCCAAHAVQLQPFATGHNSALCNRTQFSSNVQACNETMAGPRQQCNMLFHCLKSIQQNTANPKVAPAGCQRPFFMEVIETHVKPMRITHANCLLLNYAYSTTSPCSNYQD